MAKKIDRMAIIMADLLFGMGKSDGSFTKLKEDIGAIKSTIDHNLRLKEFFRSATIKQSTKELVVDKLFMSSVSNAALVYFKKLIEIDGMSWLSTIFHLYVDRVESEERIAFATVTSNVELSQEMQDSIATQFKEITGKEIVIDVLLDPSIIGGIVIRVEGKVYDASLSKRFAELHNKLLVAV